MKLVPQSPQPGEPMTEEDYSYRLGKLIEDLHWDFCAHAKRKPDSCYGPFCNAYDACGRVAVDLALLGAEAAKHGADPMTVEPYQTAMVEHFEDFHRYFCPNLTRDAHNDILGDSMCHKICQPQVAIQRFGPLLLDLGGAAGKAGIIPVP